MTTIESRTQRIRKIHEQLKLFAGGTVSKKKLIEVCESSERTLKGDLKYMREAYDAPIDFNWKTRGYYYTEDNFELLAETIALSAKELNDLKLTASTLEQFQGLEMFKDVRGIFQKLDNAVKYKILQTSAEPYVVFEQAPACEGSHLISFFYQAIEHQKAVAFTHQKFTREPKKEYVLRPYWLKEHKNRWYIIGETVHDQKFRILGLDRIVSAPAIRGAFKRKPVSLPTLMKHSFGLYISNKKPENVVLSMDYTRAQYFKAQPLFAYGEQNVLVDNMQEFRVQKKLIINPELIMELAKLGASVKVLEPESLQEKLKQYLIDAINQYT
jgi:predicted DNA-binding transcriptional regulator YafY